jgi:hypothetical protein
MHFVGRKTRLGTDEPEVKPVETERNEAPPVKQEPIEADSQNTSETL